MTTPLPPLHIMLVLATSLVSFYVLHSLLATDGMKRLAAARLGLDHSYRLCYNMLSLVLLGWVAWEYMQLPSVPIAVMPESLRRAGMLLVVLGALLSTLAVMRFGVAGFAGLRPEADTGLVRSGLHAHVRHPIHSGIMLAAFGRMLLSPTPPTLLCVSITFLYLPVGIRLEGSKLIRQHGDAYRAYRREVPPLWP